MDFTELLKERYSVRDYEDRSIEQEKLDKMWVRGFAAPKASEVFRLPENIHPVCFLVLGYPSEKSAQLKRTGRRPLEETVTIL